MMTHDCGDDIEPERHSFVIDLDKEDNSKPVHANITIPRGKSMRVKTLETYPKFETEFFDLVQSCAVYIDKVEDLKERIKFTNELNKIFIIRHKPSVMRLFRTLVNIQLTKKEA
jgi:hypothetical protein